MNPESVDVEAWDDLIAHLQNAHLLQTREWGQVKAQVGWTAAHFVWRDGQGQVCAAAMILERELRLGGFSANLKVLYIPRGPLLDWDDASVRTRVLADLEAYGRSVGALFVKVDPEVALGWGEPAGAGSQEDATGRAVEAELAQRGWRYSSDQIQFRNTVLLDLSGTEDDRLARMKQKTRYNLRLAQRKGVIVRRGNRADFAMLYPMYAETSVRDGFVIRPQGYYEMVWRTFMERDLACPLIAEVEGKPVAAVFVFWFAGRAWYIYGMSSSQHRDKMPNYLLQWEAMRLAKEKGCLSYDLWGAPEIFDESDSMWGVYRFKEGLGGRVLRSLGAWDFPVKGAWYGLY
ncbi:peptidoglycan bridge formation glycyltransferase FemA/FemB family protein, partial [bacterium]